MPCKKDNYSKSLIYDKELDEEEDDEEIKFLKKFFNINDFLEHSKTKAILEEDWKWRFALNCEGDIHNFFNSEQMICKNNLTSVFNLDQGKYGSYAGNLSQLIFNHLRPKYDLNVIYNNPKVANSIIEEKEMMLSQMTIDKKELIKENYIKKVKNKGKTFNWKTKTYDK